MTAVKPPDALTRAAALVNGQPDPLVPANQISGNIGPEVANVLMRGMSQNRDQRYPTAAGMRAALQGSGEVATLAGRSEAATVILPPASSATAATIAESAEPTPAASGETTVVQPRKRRGVPSWAIAASVGVLIGAIFLGSYVAYQRRRDAAVATPTSPTPQSSPAVAQPTQPETTTSVEPALSNTVNEAKKIESAGKRGESSARKTEAAVTNTQKSATQETAPTVPEPPNINATGQQASGLNNSNMFPDDVPGTGSAGRRRQAGTVVRKLPDGSTVLITPDGTRTIIMPDGTRRVLRPPVRRRQTPQTP